MSIVSGALSVDLLDGFAVLPGQIFDVIIISGQRTGTFTGLEEGALIGNLGVDVFITYMSGDGNDFALYSAPEPSIFGNGFESIAEGP
jgi:hypothetical protein